MQIFEGELTITSKETVARETLKLRFSVKTQNTIPPSPHHTPSTSLSFLPGQFVSMKFGEKSWRSYSIASTPEEEFELIVRLVEGGVASEVFRQSKIGDTFPFKGPFGHFVLSDTPNAHLVFCATGTGIAPFRGMIKTEVQTQNPRPMTLLYGGRNRDDIAYLDEIDTWSEDLDIQLAFSRITESEQSELQAQHPHYHIHKGRITDLLNSPSTKGEPEGGALTEYYICGNGDMVMSVQEILEEQGIPKEQVFLERFN